MEFMQKRGNPTIELAHCESNVRGLDKYFNEFKFHEDCNKALKIADGELNIHEWTEIFPRFRNFQIQFSDLQFHLECCYDCWKYALQVGIEEGDNRYENLKTAVDLATIPERK